MKKANIFAYAALSVAVLGLAFPFSEVAAQGADLPSTIVIGKGGVPGSKVTFYDFHSDRTNPEFEQPHDGSITTYGQKGLRTGMVAATLDAANKPQIGPRPYLNQGIAHWFRDWNTYTDGKYSKGKNLAPAYQGTRSFQQWCDSGCDEWNGRTNADYTSDVPSDGKAFENRVIDDIPLTLNIVNRNTGMYEYASTSFFVLDDRGFGNEWPAGQGRNGNNGDRIPNHNYSFTMELEFPFQVKNDMSFSFRGDDDVWVFIDNRLVLDLGGIHEPCTASFNVTRVLDGAFKPGENRVLRMFYVERHTSDANIKITTNIVAPPSSINVSTTSNNGGGIVTGTLDQSADEKTTLYSVIYDENGVILKLGEYNCDHVTWTITNPSGKKETKTGCSVEVADSVAGALDISVTYNDHENPPVSKSVGLNVHAIQPSHIVIQRSPERDTTVSRKIKTGDTASLGDDVYFKVTDSIVTVYALLYDKYGNHVPWGGNYNPTSVTWGPPTDPDVASVRSTSTSSTASAVVTKRPKGMGDVAELPVSFSYRHSLLGQQKLDDAAEVGAKGEPSLAIGPNPFVPGRSRVKDAFRGSQTTANYYAGVPGVSENRPGVLIAAEGAKPLKPSGPANSGPGGKTPYGKVVIYDAVGNIVRIDALYEAGGARRAYGVVWDGKNTKGRYVGPGTYLVWVTGTDVDGSALKVRKTVGVTKY